MTTYGTHGTQTMDIDAHLFDDFSEDFNVNQSQPQQQQQSMSHQQQQHQTNVGVRPQAIQNQDERQRLYNRLSQQAAFGGFCSVDEVRLLLNENMQLRKENEMLKERLAKCVKSRLGSPTEQPEAQPAPAAPSSATNKYQEFVEAQPQMQRRDSAFDELMEMKRERKEEMSVVAKKCDTSLLNNFKAHYACFAIKLKSSVCTYKFFGSGASKQEAQGSAATIAVDFLTRVFAGQKLIPLHYMALSFLYLVMMANGVEKPSECLVATQDADTKMASVALKIGEYELIETGKSKKEAKEKAAVRCLNDYYGYIPYEVAS